jgi:hypothetical protein
MTTRMTITGVEAINSATVGGAQSAFTPVIHVAKIPAQSATTIEPAMILIVRRDEKVSFINTNANN